MEYVLKFGKDYSNEKSSNFDLKDLTKENFKVIYESESKLLFLF